MYQSRITPTKLFGNGDVSNVEDMSDLFRGQPLMSHSTFEMRARFKNFSAMFAESKFKKPLDRWNVSQVTNMEGLFRSRYFDRPIGNWDA